MTPKEKAVELVDKYFIACHKSSDLELSWKVCKQCALIAVDEVLQYDINAKCESQFVIQERIEEYWKQVKTEIEKL